MTTVATIDRSIGRNKSYSDYAKGNLVLLPFFMSFQVMFLASGALIQKFNLVDNNNSKQVDLAGFALLMTLNAILVSVLVPAYSKMGYTKWAHDKLGLPTPDNFNEIPFSTHVKDSARPLAITSFIMIAQFLIGMIGSSINPRGADEPEIKTEYFAIAIYLGIFLNAAIKPYALECKGNEGAPINPATANARESEIKEFKIDRWNYLLQAPGFIIPFWLANEAVKNYLPEKYDYSDKIFMFKALLAILATGTTFITLTRAPLQRLYHVLFTKPDVVAATAAAGSTSDDSTTLTDDDLEPGTTRSQMPASARSSSLNGNP